MKATKWKEITKNRLFELERTNQYVYELTGSPENGSILGDKYKQMIKEAYNKYFEAVEWENGQ